MPPSSSSAAPQVDSSSPAPRSSSPAPSPNTTTTVGDKRARSPLEDEEEETAPSKKHKGKNDKTEEEIMYTQWGRTLARVYDAYTKPSTIINTGFKFELADDASEFSEEQHLINKSFDLITRHIPALDHSCTKATKVELKRLCADMQSGQDGARSDDTSILKKQVVEMLRDHDANAYQDIVPRVKSNRGFGHPMLGRLLCPAKLDYDDDAIRQSLKSGAYELSPTDWPTFFYEDFKFNADDELEGLLKSKLLVQAYKCIYLGPSAWDKVDGASRTTRESKASLCDMDRVTGRSIAYVASLLYFSLSSRENNSKSGGGFELSTLYWQVVRLLEDEDLKEETNELLTWWNKRIFPSTSAAKSVQDKEVDSITRLKAQKAAKKAAAALRDATNS